MSLGQVNRGYNVLGLATAARMAPIRPPAPPIVEPKLDIAWGDFHQGFFSSIRALFTWPLISRKFLGGDYFRDCWVERRIPKRAVFAAALWHIVFLVAPVSLLNTVIRHNSAFDNTQLTWSGPIEDFPNLEIAVAKPKPAPRAAADKPVAPKGADAFHPRQRIATDPVRPNHPRQTLINPKAPDIAPKVLPDLPNIVQLPAAGPARPRIAISAAALAKLHPRQRRRVAAAPNAPPLDAPTLEQKPAEIMLEASTSGPARPKLELSAAAAPRVADRAQTGDSLPAPELGAAQAAPAGGSPNSLIALSASPAPPKPNVAVPEGNLAARVSISPEGKKPGVPNGSSATTEPATGSEGTMNRAPTTGGTGSSGAGKSSVGVSISGGNPQPKNPVSGLSNPMPKISVPSSRSLMTRPEPKTDDAPERSGPPNFAALPPGAKPEQVFAAKRVYTLAVNMANLNSASGSWILHFAELGSEPGFTPALPADLSMPVPIRKVDPKYPPDLIEQNVQGEVVLYGVIRANGSVDSIQVARSLDPQLDANAKSAFAQWKFIPGSRAGAPVDLEVIAHIPFKIRDDR
jgi:TonB family protein